MRRIAGKGMTAEDWISLAAHVWTFVCILAGAVTLVRYVYKHLHWIA